MKKLFTLLVWVGLIAAFVFVFRMKETRSRPVDVPFETFAQMVEGDEIADVRVDENQVLFESYYADGTFRTLGVIDSELMQKLSESGVVVGRGESEGSSMSLLYLLGMPLVVVLVLVYFFRKMGSSNANVFDLRKSNARLVPETGKATFADVGGCVEAKELLGDLVDFLKNPGRWTSVGARLPRGVLLEGPPGCGKTLLARAVAGETDARFYSISASEFVEMFVGVGAARVRDLFETARRNTPAVIFIDELDAVGRRRGSGIGSAHDEREQTLNQLLVCLDGFEPNDRVVVIAATNRPDILDPALVRPGRFDRRIRIPELSRAERLEVLRVHTRQKPLADEVRLETVADQTRGLNGSQLESLVNEAALLAIRRTRHENNGAPRITHDDFATALKPSDSKPRLFDKLDSVLIESTSQLAEPTGRAVVRLLLVEGTQVEGEVVWVDGTFIKLRSPDGAETIVPKHQVKTIEPLAGTEATDRADVLPDRWAARQTGLL